MTPNPRPTPVAAPPAPVTVPRPGDGPMTFEQRVTRAFYIEGKNTAEIAEAEAISESAVARMIVAERELRRVVASICGGAA